VFLRNFDDVVFDINTRTPPPSVGKWFGVVVSKAEYDISTGRLTEKGKYGTFTMEVTSVSTDLVSGTWTLKADSGATYTGTWETPPDTGIVP